MMQARLRNHSRYRCHMEKMVPISHPHDLVVSRAWGSDKQWLDRLYTTMQKPMCRHVHPLACQTSPNSNLSGTSTPRIPDSADTFAYGNCIRWYAEIPYLEAVVSIPLGSRVLRQMEVTDTTVHHHTLAFTQGGHGDVTSSGEPWS
jgi:hypothetical protein